jgi:hypothetical protein
MAGGEKGAMVLTCRIEQYEALEAAHAWIHDAARVQLKSVGLPAARTFLEARTDDADRWKPVLDAMRRDANRPRELQDYLADRPAP